MHLESVTGRLFTLIWQSWHFREGPIGWFCCQCHALVLQRLKLGIKMIELTIIQSHTLPSFHPSFSFSFSLSLTLTHTHTHSRILAHMRAHSLSLTLVLPLSLSFVLWSKGILIKLTKTGHISKRPLAISGIKNEGTHEIRIGRHFAGTALQWEF